MAAKKARDLVRRKNVLKSSMLPGKLSDCSCTDPKNSGSYLFFLFYLVFLLINEAILCFLKYTDWCSYL